LTLSTHRGDNWKASATSRNLHPQRGGTEMTSSKSRAGEWKYPRYAHYQRQLREAASKWFAVRKCSVQEKHPYILDERDKWRMNMILSEVAEKIAELDAKHKEQGTPFPLHKYVHHGLSSQAMLFNLAGPLVFGDLSPLARALESKGVQWPGEGANAVFEYEDRDVFNEDSGQPTSVDLVIRAKDNHPRIFIECKLTEPDFGSCSLFTEGECTGANPSRDFSSCYLHFIGRLYWERMREHKLIGGPVERDAMCVMANHYQFFRELLVALHNDGKFVLLCDERSPTFFCRAHGETRGLMPFLSSLLTANVRERVAVLTIQELISFIKDSGQHDRWIGEFETKYGLYSS
jgi:hypothetical protein